MRFLLKMNKFVDYNNFVDSPQLRDFSITPTVWNHRSVAILDYTNDVESKVTSQYPKKGPKKLTQGKKNTLASGHSKKGPKKLTKGKKTH